MEVPDLLNLLESNHPEDVEDIKSKFHENFNATKEPWLLNGIFDYYISTNSYRMVDILVGVREPHDKYLFDRLSESLKGSQKLQSLTLLGHIVRRQPTWLYKIAQHTLMKDLLKLLKTEVDILPLMSALLVIIVLLPMIPALIGPHLQDIFDVFSRLAAWNTNNPNKLPEQHLLHLQIGLYALFHRLYGMYPCNFLSYLRTEYSVRDNLGIFSHTIKPMIDTVRMHPLLVTASKDAETATSRWKKMEHHDVIVECAKFALDSYEKSREDVPTLGLSSFRPRSPDSPHQQLKPSQIPSSSSLINQLLSENENWSPSLPCSIVTPPPADSSSTSIPQTPNSLNYSMMSPLNQEGTSPPEAAVEATPETTPIKDVRPAGVRPLLNSGVARALNTLGKWPQPPSGGPTPSHSQPSSPMKKEPSPFRFPEGSAGSNSSHIIADRRDSLFSQKIQRVRIEQLEAASAPPISRPSSVPSMQYATLSANGASIMQQLEGKLFQDGVSQSPGSPLVKTVSPAPTTKHGRQSPPHILPLETLPTSQKVVGNVESGRGVTSVMRDSVGSTSEVASTHIHLVDSSKEKTKVALETNGLQRDDGPVQEVPCLDDQEMADIVRQGEPPIIDSIFKGSSTGRQFDNVLQESNPPNIEADHVFGLDDEECQILDGSPCCTGGLHMPNSASMRDFARRVSRIRFNTDCGGVAELYSSPPSGMGSRRESSEVQADGETLLSLGKLAASDRITSHLRRVNSCPEIKKVASGNLGEVESALKEEEEEESVMKTEVGGRISSSTQTIDNNCAPLPYEHLFLSIFPHVTVPLEMEPDGMHAGDTHLSIQIPKTCYSPYSLLDKYMESLASYMQMEEKDGQKTKSQVTENENRILREQLKLWHLRFHFERLCREVHGERNRRLFGKSRTNRALEEYNNALREQLSLVQNDLENVHKDREKYCKEFKAREKQLQDVINFEHNQCCALQKENKLLKSMNEELEQDLKQEKTKVETATKELRSVESSLFAVKVELQHVLEKASAGEQLCEELEHLQKEMVLMGELQQRYRDSFSQQALQKHGEEEISLLQETCNEEIKGMQQLMDTKSASLEAAKSRVSELEAVVTRKDMLIADQKRLLKCAKEEYQEKLEAVETKYNALRAINQKLEEQLLELRHQVGRSEKGLHGPDGGSLCGSVGASGERPGSSRGGFSPHGSPLLGSVGPDGVKVYEDILGDMELKSVQETTDQEMVSPSKGTEEWVEEAAGESNDGDEG
ncbi:hypothetical protein J437_LFUL012151 [Ladona fulva]|uniref:Hamartin n=1 Tax=Ladona fulva TaxID=123851 RepID=A0A8K0KBR5_LADFU|nr:hypothetical protein J437_LFUL012151 [Ladona fulva]